MDKLVRKIEVPLAKRAIERAGLYKDAPQKSMALWGMHNKPLRFTDNRDILQQKEINTI